MFAFLRVINWNLEMKQKVRRFLLNFFESLLRISAIFRNHNIKLDVYVHNMLANSGIHLTDIFKPIFDSIIKSTENKSMQL